MRALPILIAPAILIAASAMLSARNSASSFSAATQEEIARVENEIDRIEGETMARLASPPDNKVQQIELLGKLLIYDKELSVNRNEACASVTPEAGFTGPIAELTAPRDRIPGPSEPDPVNASRRPILMPRCLRCFTTMKGRVIWSG
jgi:cytochrome c peroxidase